MNKRLWIWLTAILAVFAIAITVLELSSEQDYKKAILTSRLEGYTDMLARSGDYSQVVSLLPEGIRLSVMNLEGKKISKALLRHAICRISCYIFYHNS